MPIPIPKRSSGFTLGDPSALVKIDIFFDIQCPHSKRLWPTIVNLLKHYKAKPVNVTAHLITLSNHRQAWDMSLALFALADGSAAEFFDFTSFLFERQEQFSNAQFLNKTHADLRALAAGFAKDHAGLNREEFLKKMESHEIYIEARTPIRFAATRAVWATPTLFINNADDVPLSFDSNLSDWISAIDALLSG